MKNHRSIDRRVCAVVLGTEEMTNEMSFREPLWQMTSDDWSEVPVVVCLHYSQMMSSHRYQWLALLDGKSNIHFSYLCEPYCIDTDKDTRAIVDTEVRPSMLMVSNDFYDRSNVILRGNRCLDRVFDC
jgi:hypothetical protein